MDVSRPTEEELRKTKPWIFDPCWRCGKVALEHHWDNEACDEKIPSGHYDSQAVISIRAGDASFSGTFHIPLCFSCACLPHNQLPDGYRIL